MTAVLLALLAALAYGASDFFGGSLSRRFHYLPVVFLANTSTVLLLAVAVPFAPGSGLSRAAAGWALVAGLGGGGGGLALYRGLARGRMAVVGPVSAVGAALLPVVVGPALGERLSLLAGIGVALALPAIWLVSGGGLPAVLRRGIAAAPGHSGAGRQPALTAGLADAVVAGVGFGFLFIGLERTGEESGLWPVLISQAVPILLVTVLVAARPRPARRYVPAPGAQPRTVESVLDLWSLGIGWAAVPGVLLAVAVVCYRIAARDGMAVAAVLTSLYPAVTVLLAAALLGERVERTQLAGLSLSLAAVAAIAAG
ncbi:MAG: EamA family transporter [Micrococcales bacterium]|nr:MAG: EamA family transporter [Micrococcales bacterium]PIE26732.1 MAG: EamA family transporter [Micrococcales bacterium]